ncbi:hypothetical protein [Pelodictyon luteolum]|uniref:hypothetical protein n=1 Tax=Pelodictyon luteolum TaxID=1100 RepID=UPI0026EADF3E|nr:hypothetical protein [Pelodictyon luteolum]
MRQLPTEVCNRLDCRYGELSERLARLQSPRRVHCKLAVGADMTVICKDRERNVSGDQGVSGQNRVDAVWSPGAL